jgi:ATP-dependent helicase/DNAse subunit B
MSIQLLVAPASAGKTAYLAERVRAAARGLAAAPRVVAPTALQARAWRRRLAAAGGALGVRVLTFDQLYHECLAAAGETYTELVEPVQYRLLRATAETLAAQGRLEHYGAIAARPGFTQALQEVINELKAARKFPDELDSIARTTGEVGRLGELAALYAAYQERLIQHEWADRAGIGWLAVEAVSKRAPYVGRGWGLLAVDGFDSFTTVQIALLKALGPRVDAMVVALTGAAGGDTRAVHRRYQATRENLERELDVRAEALPAAPHNRVAPALAHLEAHLFTGQHEPAPAGGALELIEAPDRAAEARAALRWLKARVVLDGLALDDVALLARDVAPYRPFVVQIAREFGLPLRLVDGLPLRENPAIVALLALLALARALAGDAPAPALSGLQVPAGEKTDRMQVPLARRAVVAAWRSPYVDWSALPARDATVPIGIQPADASALEVAARWMRVVRDRAQWEQALAALAAHTDDRVAGDDERRLPDGVPHGPAAQDLLDKFRRFAQRLTPPAGARPYREFCAWLEDLIGPDPNLARAPHDPYALNLVARAVSAFPQGGDDPLDLAALVALKDTLRGLVWAEEAVPRADGVRIPEEGAPRVVTFDDFCDDLQGAIDVADFQPPAPPGHDALLVATALQARGLPFRAVAVLGLAEGSFPVALREDPFLRDRDREHLKIDLSTESAEREFFYEAVTRPRERLLLTRPRLADNGAEWQASPFWEEVRRLVDVRPLTLTSDALPAPGAAASWPELLESAAAGSAGAQAWAHAHRPDEWARVESAAALVRGRAAGPGAAGAYDGDLRAHAGEFAAQFAAGNTVWSASRLELYRTCPYAFFAGYVLDLEPREEPEEGLDSRQLGNIYHRIFEQLFKTIKSPRRRTDLAYLLARLDDVARPILDRAPQQEGFNAAAWWHYTREEIVENVRASLRALAALPGEFVPMHFEQYFKDCVVPGAAGDRFVLKGFIDRVDVAPDGTLRLIDYKTSSPYAFTAKSAEQGKKLQLGLYALAARDALRLGKPVDGFYWHVRQAEPSAFTLRDFGAQAAIDTAVAYAWQAVHGARAGAFAPQPPDDGCPPYCPAAAFCWHYRQM